MSQMENTQKTAADMLPGQSNPLSAKYYYRELDGKIVPLYTKDDFVTAGLSCLGDGELQPSDTRTMQELVYPPRHVKTEETGSIADIPHQATVTTALTRTSMTPTARIEHRTYQPTTIGSLGVKKYCTHWLRTGECDFNQQGCLFEHVIPDEETMFGVLGFKTIPRWIRESGRELPFAPHANTPPVIAPLVTERAYTAPSPSPAQGMYMGRMGNHGRPSADMHAPKYGSTPRASVGPTSKPYPAQGYQTPRPVNTGGGRMNSYRPTYSRSHLPSYTPMLPSTPYSGRGDMGPINRSMAPSPTPSDYSIASNNSFMTWQPSLPSLPPRPTSVLSSLPGLTTTGGYSSNSSVATGQLTTPSSASLFVPGSSSIYGGIAGLPRPPVPHIEHRRMFVGKKTGGNEGKGTVKPVEKEEGEVVEDNKSNVMKY